MARLYTSGNQKSCYKQYMCMLLKNLATITETSESFMSWPPHLQLASYITACSQLYTEGGLVLSAWGPATRRMCNSWETVWNSAIIFSHQQGLS